MERNEEQQVVFNDGEVAVSLQQAHDLSEERVRSDADRHNSPRVSAIPESVSCVAGVVPVARLADVTCVPDESLDASKMDNGSEE